MKASILKNITQVILIVFSVVLGLYLSERIEERKNDKEATKLLSKIKSELNENKKLLDHWVPYHEEMLKRLDSLAKNEIFVENFIKDNSSLYQVFTRGTIMGETPANDAWDIAKSHPLIVHFDYADLLILSKIYNQQSMTYEPAPRIIELLLSPDFNSKEKAKPNLQAFRNQLREIVTREIQLMNYLKEAEEILEL